MRRESSDLAALALIAGAGYIAYELTKKKTCLTYEECSKKGGICVDVDLCHGIMGECEGACCDGGCCCVRQQPVIPPGVPGVPLLPWEEKPPEQPPSPPEQQPPPKPPETWEACGCTNVEGGIVTGDLRFRGSCPLCWPVRLDSLALEFEIQGYMPEYCNVTFHFGQVQITFKKQFNTVSVYLGMFDLHKTTWHGEKVKVVVTCDQVCINGQCSKPKYCYYDTVHEVTVDSTPYCDQAAGKFIIRKV